MSIIEEINPDTTETEPEAGETVAGSEHEPEAGAGEPEPEETEPEETETVVTLGDEPPAPSEEETRAPEWVRQLRKSQRELQRENRELKQRLEQNTAETNPAVSLGPKPTLEDDEIDFDPDKYERALADWIERKRRIEEAERATREEAEKAKNDWETRLAEYGKSKERIRSELKLADYDDAESDVDESLNATQKGIIIHGSENPGLLVYAIGKDSKVLAELAKIKDPVKFAFEVAKLEATKLKVTKRATPPPPERKVDGVGRVSNTTEATLERLREEAERIKDITKVVQYKRLNKK